MVDLPWRSAGGDDDADTGGPEQDRHDDAVVVCRFQDGTLAVYEEAVEIERVSRSKFADKTIPMDEISGVDHNSGITIGYIQIEQVGVELGTGTLLSDPVNENTLHFGWGSRECAREARDAILERAGG